MIDKVVLESKMCNKRLCLFIKSFRYSVGNLTHAFKIDIVYGLSKAGGTHTVMPVHAHRKTAIFGPALTAASVIALPVT